MLNSITEKSIPNGTKFVALFYDGSGAGLFLIDDAGDLYDHYLDYIGNAPDDYLLDAGYGYWMELPSKFKLWFEQKKDTP